MPDDEARRRDLIRMVPVAPTRADGDGRTLFGYAARFNKPTMIDSWEGRFIEKIEPGAFARSLKNSGGNVKVLFNHGMDPSIGDKPLGRATTIAEDDKGLFVEVPLARTSYNDDLIALLDAGALDGMSFRFTVPTGGDDWEYPKGKLPVRTLTEVKLLELGPVTFPAYEATSAGVRSRDEFTIWRSLPQATQAELFRIITGTRDASPGPPSPVLDDPAHGHSSDLIARARQALDILKGETK